MASETVDSHQTSTSDEQTVKLNSEAVKAEEQIKTSSLEESVEADREKDKADKLQTPHIVLSTSEEKAEDIQVEPPVIEIKKTDETPVVDIPVHNNVKLEKESSPDKSSPEEQPSASTESVGGEPTEPAVIASVEKCVENSKVVDENDNVKSPPEKKPAAEFVASEALEVQAIASTEKVQEQTPKAVDVPNLEVKSSDYTVDNQAKKQPTAAVQSVIGVPEELGILPVPAEKIEENKPEIIDNPELSVAPTADSGTGPTNEQPDTESVGEEKEQKEQQETTHVPELTVEALKKEEQQIEVLKEQLPPKTCIPELSVEPPKKEEQQIEVLKEQPEKTCVPELSVESPKKEEKQIEVLKEKPDTTCVPELSVEPPKKEEQLIEVLKEQPEITCAPDLSVESPKKEEKQIEALKEKPDTTCVPELSVEPPKKEEQQIEVFQVKETVEVIAKEITEKVEPPMEKEQPIEVHPVKGSEELMAKEISKLLEVSKEKEQASEVHPVQESVEVIAKKVSEEVDPAKELVVVAKESGESIEPLENKEQLGEVLPIKESEEIIAKEINASFEPPKNKKQSDEGFPATESGEVQRKESSGSTLGSVELEKQESEAIEVKDSIREFPEITNRVQNNNVEVEAEVAVKGETVKDEKILDPRDDISPPLGGEKIHEEEKQYTVQSDKQDSVGQIAQPNVELAPEDSSLDVEEKTNKGNEKKESSNVDVVAKLLKEVVTAVEKVGEEVKNEKADEDRHEKTEESILPTEEEVAKDSSTAAEVAEKSIDDKKTGEEDALIAETKIEESTKDEKPALVETGNAEHVVGRFDVNETPKEFQEPEVEIKDKETMITGVEDQKLDIQTKESSKKEGDEIKSSQDLQKEVPSKPTHKQSHNILSKVKQSLVKAKKAIIGKSPNSKSPSSEARDDIKVK